MAVVCEQGSSTGTTMGVVNPMESHVVSYDADHTNSIHPTVYLSHTSNAGMSSRPNPLREPAKCIPYQRAA